MNIETAFSKANALIAKKKESLLIDHINNAAAIIHETEYHKILDFLKDKGINLSSLNDIPINDSYDMIKVYFIKKGVYVGDHAHKFIESYICLSGLMRVRLDNAIDHYIKSFDTFKVEKYQVHSVEFLDDTFLVVFAN